VGRRLFSLFRAVLYLGFAVSTASVLSNPDRQGDGDQRQQAWTARVMGWPGGRWLVGAVGLGVIAVGIGLAWRGLARKFEKRLDLAGASEGTRRGVETVGVVGTVARGVVSALIGALLITSAVQHTPQKAEGVDGTLRLIAQQPYGKVLLVVTALGLAAFGLFSFAEARYRRL
jgi:hypothetical protein